MAIANDSPVRHQPAGAFQIEHFMNPGDNRSHIDRINPLDGKSPADGTGAHGVYHATELATDNVSGLPLWCQEIPAPAEEPAAAVPAGDELFYE